MSKCAFSAVIAIVNVIIDDYQNQRKARFKMFPLKGYKLRHIQKYLFFVQQLMKVKCENITSK